MALTTKLMHRTCTGFACCLPGNETSVNNKELPHSPWSQGHSHLCFPRSNAWQEPKPTAGTESKLREKISFDHLWGFKPQLSLSDLSSTHLLTFFHFICTECRTVSQGQAALMLFTLITELSHKIFLSWRYSYTRSKADTLSLFFVTLLSVPDFLLWPRTGGRKSCLEQKRR